MIKLQFQPRHNHRWLPSSQLDPYLFQFVGIRV